MRSSAESAWCNKLFCFLEAILLNTVAGCAVSGINCLRPLEHWDREFECHSRHACFCAFILCVGSGLAMG
jgi:hypothetical protein